MAKIPTQPHLSATRLSDGAARPPHRPREATAAARRPVRTHTLGQVVILDVDGPLTDVVEGLDRSTRLALAGTPRGVVCDLSGVVEPGATGALRGLATSGRHPRDWPGAPVAMAGLDPHSGATLRGKPLGDHLVVSESLRQALSSVLQARAPVVASLRLAPLATAPQAAGEFLNQTLLEWRLGRHIPAAAQVVTELVTDAISEVRSDIELTVSWHRRAIRIAVRDGGPDPPAQGPDGGAPRPGLTAVTRLSQAYGVLPSADGGRVVWAVLDASPDLAR
jgi:hypothetical protein